MARRSNLHDLRFLGLQCIIDLANEAVGQLLHVIRQGTMFVLADIAVFFHLLERIHAIAPDIADRVQQIVLMGGAYFEVGNITPTAEFNIYVDPEAADIVFKSGIDIVVMSLDVTHKALVTKPRNDAFRALGTPVGVAVAQMTDFFERFDKEKYGSAGAPLHDPCVTAYLIRPDLFTGRHVNVEVETASPLTLGMTVADWWGVTDRAPNATFRGDIDADGFFDLLTDRLARL